MTPDQITFDRAARVILTQRGPSVDAHHRCAYRGPNGLKCAAGDFIPDDWYTPELEGKGVQQIAASIEPGHNLNLLESLQHAHDVAASVSLTNFMDNWLDEMNLVAADFNLNLDVFREA